MLLRSVGFVLCSFFLFHSSTAFGFAPDPRLLQLVPPESRMIAGVRSSPDPGQLSGILMVTRNNEMDRDDFLALTGGDLSLRINEAVFLAAGGPDGQLIEHSVLVSGHFDRDAIFRLASDGGATRQSYRGIAVLAVQPFAREAGSMRELRWLAIPDQGLAIWGTVASVQHELDRWIANSPADPELLERISQLDDRDETWCLLPAPRADGPVANILGSLDARLEALAGQGRPIQFGIHIGRNVEITASSGSTQQPGWNPRSDPPGFAPMAFSFLAGSGATDVSKIVRITIRRQAYQRWLAMFSETPPASVVNGSVKSGSAAKH